MARTVIVTFDGEVLRPEEPLNLAPNTRYCVSIEDSSTDDGSRPAPGVFDDLLELAQELDLPPDFAAQLDHYIHGVPKR